MDLHIQGKQALVTGSTAGIGLAIATALAAEGAHVILNGRTEERVKEAIAAVRRSCRTADLSGEALDLGTRPGAEELIRRRPEVDILINNLGIFEAKPFGEIPDEDWMRFFQVNVLSGVRLSRHYLPGMLKRNWGRIVFISSESALQIPVEMIHYGMTKTAQLAVARGLAEMTAGTGVTVNSVLPGPTSSEGVTEWISGLARSRGVTPDAIEREFFEKTRPSSIIQRFATPEEVGSMVAYVCSTPAAAVNGAALRVDGGVVRAIA